MTPQPPNRPPQTLIGGAVPAQSALEDAGEIELTDADILDAMREIPGYLDITTADFRTIYHLAHRHAIDRLFRGIDAGRLMRSGVRPLVPETPLAEAIPLFVAQGLKTLPVVTPDGQVVGVLTETDIIRALGAGTFLDFLNALLAGSGSVGPDLGRRLAGELMTAPAVTVPTEAGVQEVLAAFAAHPGRGMPVVGPAGRLAGVLLRKDFMRACPLGGDA